MISVHFYSWRDGEARNYAGARTVEGFTEFANSMTSSPVKIVNDGKTLDDETSNHPVAFVFFGPKNSKERVSRNKRFKPFSCLLTHN